MKDRITTLFAGGVLALALFGVARAGPFEDAQAADQKGDYATEMQILRPLAEQGNALAQLGLGVMYANGQGVPQDYAQAVVWYRKAAEQGDPDAQTIVALMYVNGHGVSQDYAQALIWYRKAADQGNGSAQLGLGLMYANGHDFFGRGGFRQAALVLPARALAITIVQSTRPGRGVGRAGGPAAIQAAAAPRLQI
jgi:TPR repeat protein